MLGRCGDTASTLWERNAERDSCLRHARGTEREAQRQRGCGRLCLRIAASPRAAATPRVQARHAHDAVAAGAVSLHVRSPGAPDAHFDAETAAEDRLRRRSALLPGRDKATGGWTWAMARDAGMPRGRRGSQAVYSHDGVCAGQCRSVHAAHVSTWALAVSSFVMVQLLSLAVWFGRQKDPSKTK